MSTVQEAPPITSIARDIASFNEEGVSTYSIDADTFCRMIDANVFRQEDRVWLWDGRICETMAKNKPRSFSSAKAMYSLIRVAPPGWVVWPENPITLDRDRVPLPDFGLIRGVLDDYLDRYPAAADIGLIIELSDSSLRFDTGLKLAGYAAANIPVYWVVNLVQNLMQAYEEPIPAERRYARETVYAAGQAVPLRLDGVLVAEIPALDLLPIRG